MATTVKTTTKKAPKKAAPKKKTAGEAIMKVAVYDASGKEVRSIDLPEALFDVAKNDSLVYQVVTSMEANARTPIAHTKDRGEVRGGGRKPWKQKGTGRARHGSTRSPIWRGGGVTHGPRNDKDYSRRINKKMRMKALATVLSAKLRDGEILFVDAPDMKAPKTADAKAFLGKLSKVKGFETLATRRNNAALIALGAQDMNVKKSFQNMGNVFVEESRNLNPVDVLNYRYLVVANPEAAIEALTNRMK